MNRRDQHLNRLRLAEQQFRLACTVHLAVANEAQTLDVPVEWTFGTHRVFYEDFGLRPDQAPGAALHLEMTATFVMASVIRDAIVALFENPKSHTDARVADSYQISRLVRNAFAHSMLYPVWSIDDDCRDRTFAIESVIALQTAGLHGTFLEWKHYGGPLAIFYFGRFVRGVLLGDPVDPHRQKPTFPKIVCYQQGRLIARRLRNASEAPPEALKLPAGKALKLGHGHWLRALDEER